MADADAEPGADEDDEGDGESLVKADFVVDLFPSCGDVYGEP